MESLNTSVLVIIGAVITLLMVAGLILSRLYEKASKSVAFVRTGAGGQKVVKDGGAIVLPVLHEIVRVNMNTLRLEVSRHREASLITKDRMRIDVTADFYLRVRPDEAAIANAAQTLGKLTMDANGLKDLMEAKFVNALRTVAAEMELEVMHEHRAEFVQRVRNVLADELDPNGLEMETVSLTSLNQTAIDHLDANNLFDAEGLTKITAIIEARRNTRNTIEQDTRVQIETKNLETDKKTLDIVRARETAVLEQERLVAELRATQQTDIQKIEADKARESQEAQIEAELKIRESQINAAKIGETLEIQKQADVKAAEIARKQMLDTRDIESRRAVEIADQDRTIAIAQKSEEEAAARARAEDARAIQVVAEQNVKTAEEVAAAERRKSVEIIRAKEAAEKDAVAVIVQAKAEHDAAHSRAMAVTTEARAAADSVLLAAGAQERKYAVDAEGARILNEARNTLSTEQIELELRKSVIEAMPGLIAASVKPLENIESIRLVDMGGTMGATGGNGGGDGSTGSLPDQVVQAALKHSVQRPILASLLQEIGLEGDNPVAAMGGLANTIKSIK
jgi:uncharacterized membrane protein YqiK